MRIVSRQQDETDQGLKGVINPFPVADECMVDVKEQQVIRCQSECGIWAFGQADLPPPEFPIQAIGILAS